ncbi:MAG: GNAT family N-acetyltransferase [Oceanospirillaceae bacterium]
MSRIHIEQLTKIEYPQAIAPLAEILHQCVEQGASVGFIQPFTLAKSTAYWQGKLLECISSERQFLWVAKAQSLIVGCVILDIDTPPNQQHRADVAKLLVHPNYHRQGIAKQLMLSIEQQALLLERSLLVLDTKTGDSAQNLYSSLGYKTAGIIPEFALNPALDGYAATTIMYKNLLK